MQLTDYTGRDEILIYTKCTQTRGKKLINAPRSPKHITKRGKDQPVQKLVEFEVDEDAERGRFVLFNSPEWVTSRMNDSGTL